MTSALEDLEELSEQRKMRPNSRNKCGRKAHPFQGGFNPRTGRPNLSPQKTKRPITLAKTTPYKEDDDEQD